MQSILIKRHLHYVPFVTTLLVELFETNFNYTWKLSIIQFRKMLPNDPCSLFQSVTVKIILFPHADNHPEGSLEPPVVQEVSCSLNEPFIQ